MRLKFSCGLCVTNAFAVDTAIAEETNPPLFHRASKNLCTTWSKLPKSNGLPRGKILRPLQTSRFSFFALASSSLYKLANQRALLSFNGLSFVPNFFAAVTGPFNVAYFPIWIRPSLVIFPFGR